MRLSFFFIFIFLSIFFFSCQKQDEIIYDVPDIFLEYTERFKQEAKLRGQELDFEKTGLIIEFQNTDSIITHAVGICYFSHEGSTPKIGLSESFWNSASEEDKEFTIFHELGHCILNRDHKNTLLSNGNWASMMRGYPESPNDHQLDYSQYRRYYLDELFDPSTPLLTNPSTIELTYPDASALVNYDITALGQTQSKDIILTNTGDDTLTISSIDLCNHFSTNFTSTILFPNSQKTLRLTFSPSNTGIHYCTAYINSNTPNEPQIDVILRGIGASHNSNWMQIKDFKGSLLSSTFSIGNKGYVINFNNEVWEYDPIANQWNKKNNFPGHGRSNPTTFVINGKGYLMLGSTIKDLWEYTPLTDTWVQKADFPGDNRIGAAGFAINNKGYVGGGSSPISANLLMDFWEYNTITNTWTQKQNLISPFNQGVSFTLDNKGCIGLGTTNSNLYEYTPASDQWMLKTNYPGLSYISSAVFVINNVTYIGTGTNSNYIDSKEFWQYSNNTWQQIADFPIEKFANATFVINNKAYVGGGFISSYGPVFDFWEFIP